MKQRTDAASVQAQPTQCPDSPHKACYFNEYLKCEAKNVCGSCGWNPYNATGKTTVFNAVTWLLGSPPRMRGKVYFGLTHKNQAWITPASGEKARPPS